MRLIDADALIIKVRDLVEEYERRMPNWSMNDMLTSGRDAAAKWGYKADGVEDALKLIIDAPIIKAEPIKYGQWEWEPGYVGTQARCSVCKRSPIGFYSLSKIQIGRLPEYPFCPKCGARMDGEDNANQS